MHFLLKPIHYTHKAMIKWDKINPCAICNNPFTDRHHLVPKEMFGLDSDDNVVYLCANHHRIVHFLLDIERINENGGPKNKKLEGTYLSLFFYILTYESEAYGFFKDCVTPAIIQRLMDINREHGESDEEFITRVQQSQVRSQK